MNCEDIKNHIPWLIDNELVLKNVLEIEKHLETCTECSKYHENEMILHSTIHRAGMSINTPHHLHQRIEKILVQKPSKNFFTSSWYRIPVFIAIMVIFTSLIWKKNTHAALDLDDAAVYHARNLPLDVVDTDSKKIQKYLSDKLLFRVDIPRISHSFSKLGGRITQLHNQDIAYIRFSGDNKMLSVFIYKNPSVTQNRIQKKKKVPLILRKVRGYMAARWHSNGLVYSAISDLSEKQFIKAVSFSDHTASLKK